MKKHYRLFWGICLVIFMDHRSHAQTAQWDFNGDLLSSTGHPPLIPSNMFEGQEPEVRFVNDTIDGASTEVMYFGKGTYFKLFHNFTGVNQSKLINNHTIIMDIKIPKPTGGLIALINTRFDFQNENDGDWHIGRYGEFGVAGFTYGFRGGGFEDEPPDEGHRHGSFKYNQWNRIALVYDDIKDEARFYLNGNFDFKHSDYDHAWRLYLRNPLLLFADSREHSDAFVGSIQLQQDILSDEQLKEIGKPSAAGIPLPQKPTITFGSINSPAKPNQPTAGESYAIQWKSEHPQGVVKIELHKDEEFEHHIGNAIMSANQVDWLIPFMIEEGDDYQIKLTWMGDENISCHSEPFRIDNPRSPLHPLYGENLIQNPEFIEGLNHWTILKGNPKIEVADKNKDEGLATIHGKTMLYSDTHEAWEIQQTIDLYNLGFSEKNLKSPIQYIAERSLVVTGQNLHKLSGAILRNYKVDFLDRKQTQLKSSKGRYPLIGILPTNTRFIKISFETDNPFQLNYLSRLSELTFKLEPVALDTGSEVVIEPYLQYKSPNAMTVMWGTNGNNNHSSIEWGQNGSLTYANPLVTTIPMDMGYFIHQAELSPLFPNQTYSYRIHFGDKGSELHSFNMIDLESFDGKIAWFAESADYLTTFTKAISKMKQHDPRLLISAGGAVQGYSDRWERFVFDPLNQFDLLQSIPIIFTPGIGNHTRKWGHEYSFSAYTSLPNHGLSFQYKINNAVVLFLNSDVPKDQFDAQTKWLIEELQKPATQSADFRVACFRHPPFSDYWHDPGYDGNPEIRENWVPLFEKHNVDLVINGYVDYYLRGGHNGVRYAIIGGAGGYIDDPDIGGEKCADWGFWDKSIPQHHYVIMEWKDRKIHWTAYDLEDNIIDQFVMEKKPSH